MPRARSITSARLIRRLPVVEVIIVIPGSVAFLRDYNGPAGAVKARSRHRLRHVDQALSSPLWTTVTRRSAQCNLVAPSTFVLPSAQISRGPLPLPQCCFRFVESRRFSRLEGVGSSFRYHIPFQRIACFLADLPSRHAGFHKRLKK